MMENSLAPELHALRNSMIPSMLEIIEKNAPFYDSLKVYDIGKSRTLHPEKQEHDMLAIALLLENNTDRKQSAWLQLK
jgi:phenylalanyl-tRNA synthetase beta subunit